MDKLTWRELRNFMNQLPDAELDKPVRWIKGDMDGFAEKVESLTKLMVYYKYVLTEYADLDRAEREDAEPGMKVGEPLLYLQD